MAYAQSKLSVNEQIKQVQYIAYLSGDKNDHNNGGDFVYWPDGASKPYQKIPAIKNTVIITDGARVAHGVTEWHPNGVKQQAPALNKDNENIIQYIGDNKWQLFVNGAPGQM